MGQGVGERDRGPKVVWSMGLEAGGKRSSPQLLGLVHMLPADDTHSVRRVQLRRRRIREPLLHVAHDCPVPHEVGYPRPEAADREVEVAQNVEGQAVVGADEAEEGDVYQHVEQVGRQVQVEEPHALVVPLAAQPDIVHK
eukprot:scaffold12543_cov115-Isochrysis_galbana.AAC.15